MNINQKSDAEQIRQDLYKDQNSILFPYINALEQIHHNAVPYSFIGK